MAEDPEEINPQLIYICTIPLEDIMMYMTPLPVHGLVFSGTPRC